MTVTVADGLRRGPQVIDADAAAALVGDGATVAFTGSGGGVLEADELFAAIERRFLSGHGPRDLTVVHALGIGDRDRRGLNALAHPGLVRRVIGGHWSWSPTMQRLAAEDAIEAYTLPAGVISLLLRETGAGRPGLITRSGLGTFADPRQRGGKANAAASDDLVELLLLDGHEYLRYRPIPVDVGIVRGSVVDTNGNVSLLREPAQLDALAVAQAARASGGTVIVQVKEQLDQPLDPLLVHLPGVLLDAIVVAPSQWQTYEAEHDPALTGGAPYGGNGAILARTTLSDPVRAVVARRAAREAYPGARINVGFGLPSEVVDVLDAEGRLEDVELCIEQGLIGGVPVSGDLFGVSRWPRVVLPGTTQFDLFAGGLIDLCFLGIGEVDARGCVNVSRLANLIVGPGGFIDISQFARRTVFCGLFTAKGAEIEVGGGSLRIIREGQVRKFINEVAEVSFSGPLAASDGREAIYVTERAVFRLGSDGLELIEIAPGIDLERDILAHMDFEPIVRDPVMMDPSLFVPSYDRRRG